jgi:hypothetical protein
MAERVLGLRAGMLNLDIRRHGTFFLQIGQVSGDGRTRAGELPLLFGSELVR